MVKKKKWNKDQIEAEQTERQFLNLKIQKIQEKMPKKLLIFKRGTILSVYVRIGVGVHVCLPAGACV